MKEKEDGTEAVTNEKDGTDQGDEQVVDPPTGGRPGSTEPPSWLQRRAYESGTAIPRRCSARSISPLTTSSTCTRA